MVGADHAASDALGGIGTPPSIEVPCDLCGGPTYEVRCKTICRRCGFTRDCSDP